MERAIITLLLDTGLRAAELASLRLDNLQAGQIRVVGKGSKPRILALNERPRVALDAYLADQAPTGGSLWPEGFNRKSLAYLLKGIGKRAGIKGRVFAHRFRHTFASRFHAETGDPLALQALLGHSSLTMVKRYIAAAQADIALAAHREHSPMESVQDAEAGEP